MDVTPLVCEARAVVLKAANIYLRHTGDRLIGLTVQGSALKGGFIPGCSDIDLKLYLRDSAFASKWQLPLELSIAMHRDLSMLDPSPFGYIQCYALPGRLVADHPIAYLGPTPGTYHLLAGELPVPEASAAEVRNEVRRTLSGIEPMPFDIAGDVLEHGGSRLDRVVRLLCTKVWPVLYSVAGHRSANPVGVWNLPKDEVISLHPADKASGLRVREFYGSVLSYYLEEGRSEEGRSVDGALTLIERGVGFLRAAREWYLELQGGGRAMKAVVFYEPHRPLSVEELDLDGPRAGEARVKIAGAGVCHSDYHRVDGHSEVENTPFVMGHEGAGIVEEVGPGVTDVAPGDHVIFSLTYQCGRCRNCAAGRPNLCDTFQRRTGLMPDGTTRFSRDGVPYYHGLATFSEETVVPAEFLVKVREDIPIDKLCLIGCGVMTGVGAVVNRARVETGSTVAVFGCGGVGLNVVQGAVLAAASKIIAVDKVRFKLEKAEELGATHVVDADREDPVKRIIELTGGGADYAFEVIGFPDTVRQAFESVRPGGTAVMVGAPAHGAEISIPAQPLFMDRTLMGTFYGAGRPRVDFPGF